MFLVIAVTVLWSALTGPHRRAAARRLRRKADAGWVIVGANTLARRIARVLDPTGTECLLIDVDPQNLRAAEEDGLRAIQSNALEPATLVRAELDTRTGALSITGNEDVNFLFAQKARRAVRSIRYGVALHDVGARRDAGDGRRGSARRSSSAPP
ncbi:MAG: NAD-binding protein [Sandaracinaceae bacterium]|nr:NAD-binding protein [Sandaracinaceae bacterium]